MRSGGIIGRIVSGVGAAARRHADKLPAAARCAGRPRASALTGETGGATQETLQQIRQLYGLDQPLYRQFLIYVFNVLHGDFGIRSISTRPSRSSSSKRLGPTILLICSSLVSAVSVGLLLGALAAQRPAGMLSNVISVLSLVGFSAPVFWTGIILLLVFASWIPLFPVQGMVDPRISGGLLPRSVDVLHHLVLPALTLGSVYLAQYSRLARTGMIEALGSDYIRTARAKGVSERSVVYKHALRNAILPVVTVAGVHVSQLLAGAVLVETVFGWPGMGRLAYESILRRDVPLMLGILFFAALLVIVANILTDLTYRAVDPRIGVR